MAPKEQSCRDSGISVGHLLNRTSTAFVKNAYKEANWIYNPKPTLHKHFVFTLPVGLGTNVYGLRADCEGYFDSKLSQELRT